MLSTLPLLLPSLWSPPGGSLQAASLTRGGGRNSLRFLVGKCHARLPWLACQYQLPAEAAVLSAVRATWQQAAASSTVAEQKAAGATAGPGLDGSSNVAAAAPRTAEASTSSVPEACSAAQLPSTAHSAPPPPPRPQQAQQLCGGPLLLFPDTSALLSMLGAHSSVAAASGVTLRALGELAQQGRFGRALDPKEQVRVWACCQVWQAWWAAWLWNASNARGGCELSCFMLSGRCI